MMLPPAPPVSAAQARYGVLAVFFFGTTLELILPDAGLLALNILSSYSIFLWYCRDRDATGRRRSLLRNLGVILLPFVAVPLYLMRHRPWRQKVRALLRFTGFGGLIILSGLAGALATAVLAGLLGLHYDPLGNARPDAPVEMADASNRCSAVSASQPGDVQCASENGKFGVQA